MKKIIIWVSALAVGAVLGSIGNEVVNDATDFVASVFTRLFQLLAVPTIALAVANTLTSFGACKDTGKVFLHTLSFTLLTTISAAAVGLLLYCLIQPESIMLVADTNPLGIEAEVSVYEHVLAVIPNNIVKPFAEGNVFGILIIAAAIGLGVAHLPESEEKNIIMKALSGLQSLLFVLIRALIWALPLGIVAFAAQLSAQISSGVVVGSLGKYVAVILGGNAVQFFVVLPLFLLAHRINPLRVLRGMTPAVLMALFTKSSAATLPVTMESAVKRLGISERVAHFVLPICTTINMNGCAAFILVTSLFVMQSGGIVIDLPTMCVWLLISVISAVGNAGVPMGCYFLTFSLMSGIGAPVGIMGVILPLYTLIDMVETAENVWSDSCVCSIVENKLCR